MVQAGFIKIPITPPIGTSMAGFAARKDVSQGIHDHLHAGILVLEAGRSAALVSVDLIGMPADLVQKIQQQSSEATGIPAEAIIIAASHTHSGPELGGPGSRSEPSSEYVQYLSSAVAGGIRSAWKHRKPARIGVGTGRIEGIGVNRRTPDGLPVDPEVGILRIDHEDGSPAGLVMNYTCHPVVLGPDNLYISADYVGFASRLIEQAMGGGFHVQFTQGASGDINTGHSADLSALGYPIPGRTFARAKQLGTMLAGEVLKVYASIETTDDLTLSAASGMVQLPVKPLPPLEELEYDAEEKRNTVSRLEQAGTGEQELIRARVDQIYAELLVQRARERGNQAAKAETLGAAMHAVRIGSCAWASFPGELFVEIGLAVKRESPFRPTWVIGYANGSIGYLPTAAAIDAGGYEAVSSRFDRQGEALVREEALRLLKELK